MTRIERIALRALAAGCVAVAALMAAGLLDRILP